MDQEKETKRQAERCRALAQRIVRELTPASIQVLGGSGALAEALEKAGAQLLPENAEQGTAALLVVEDPEWVDLPALQCAQVLLVCTDASAMADCAKQLAAQGLYRDFEWKNRGKAQQTALFCRSAAVQDAQQLLAGYEMTLDDLRERMQQAERTGEELTAQLERLRSDLSLSRSHEQDLEKTLNNVTSSTFWKMSWPLRYFVSKGRQLAHTFPPFVFLGQLRRVGISGVRAQALHLVVLDPTPYNSSATFPEPIHHATRYKLLPTHSVQTYMLCMKNHGHNAKKSHGLPSLVLYRRKEHS